MDVQSVVEVRRQAIADVGLEHERFESLFAQSGISTRVLRQVRDARNLEPDEVIGVVGDPLRVRLGEADGHLGAEAEIVHGAAL